ncbi:hypothetical protein PENSTE_c019G06157 [Penicillium steckii]|uniref:ATP-grasp domain-containing protein n=1 Tax=Penicillium steckii TaxID=303698 RepID=A0A1V6SV28_9EURO|nr:hypothetical protein PENSTE_c019G06157 [Penicillium steckii]
MLVIDAGSETPVKANLDPAKIASILKCLNNVTSAQTVAFVVPKEEGYVIRNDIFQDRLHGCLGIQKVVSLVRPRQFVGSLPATAQGLVKSIELAVCCILIDGVADGSAKMLSDYLQLRERLSLQWLSPTPIPLRRLAVVGEIRPAHLSSHFFIAARSLGVEVVALGPRGHWLQNPEYPNRAAVFLELDLTVDPGLPESIVAALQAYGGKIDGITTVTEYLLIPVAQAAEKLGLPTSPSTSFIKSVNKHQTRLLDNPNSCHLVTSLDTFQSQLSPEKQDILPPGPPWIVKPCNGWHSLGVAKVATKKELLAAVKKVAKYAAYSRNEPNPEDPQWQTNVLIEEYCDGPEVDCNFVLWEGQILFFQAIDNFPCAGDAVTEDMQTTENFKETQLLFPSALPPSELNILKSSLYDTITRLGFRSGVFHVEARVRDSSYCYRAAGDDEILDLRPNLEPQTHEASVFLIEVNARPPGYVDTCASYYADGVDLFALQILIALGDEFRTRALSQPYHSTSNVVVSAIQAKKAGTIESADPWNELAQKNPTLMGNVVHRVMAFGKGDRIDNPLLDTTPWLSAFTACSLGSRADVLNLCSHVKREFECEIA